jgi:hypothetical protein
MDSDREQHPGLVDPDPDLYSFQGNVKINFKKFKYPVQNTENYDTLTLMRKIKQSKLALL